VRIPKLGQAEAAVVRGSLREVGEAQQTLVVEAGELRTVPHRRTWSSLSPCSFLC
jgi:hypothetical protein